MKRAIVFGLALMLMASVATAANSVVLRVAEDNGLFSLEPGANGGQRGRWQMGRLGTGNDGVLMKWDLSGVSIPDTGASGKPVVITAAYINILGCSSDGQNLWDMNMHVHPLNDPFQEGLAYGDYPGSYVGDHGWPWGPTAVGDSSFHYKTVATVNIGSVVGGHSTPQFDNTLVGATGTAWVADGARGVGTDVGNNMTDTRLRGLYGNNSSHREGGISNARSLGLTRMNAAGRAVVQGWIDNPSSNNGVSIWGAVPADSASANGNLIWWTYGDIDHYGRFATREHFQTSPTNPKMPMDWYQDNVSTAASLTIEYGVSGDATDDGYVSGADYTVWAGNYDPTGGVGTFDCPDASGDTYEVYVGSNGYARATIADGDWSGDGIVSGADYTLWAGNYTGAPPAAVPEPATLTLVGVGVLALLRRKR